MATILFDGVAYGMLLFVLACGLAVMLGLMNFVNLAHGAFAMAGGYVTVILMDRWGVPFLACLPVAFVAAAALGFVLERTLYVHMYNRSHLDQVLFSIGLVFMAVAAVDWAMGSSQQNVKLPPWLVGRTEVLGVNVGLYRSFIIVICGVLALGLQLALTRTRFGSRLRAAVDDARVARGLGIPVGTVFAVTFAVGSGLAGLGGALGVEILGLDPNFPLRFMIYFLIVVTVGGTSGITGPFVASLLPAGKYLILNEIAILALFTLSLDLILGYAGIVSLGHAAFFGAGAYAAGLLAKHVTGDPLAGLALAIAVATVLGFLTSFLVLRGSDLTRLMVTLGVALVLGELANALPHISGGADGLQGVIMGKLLGRFEFDLFGRTAYAYSLTTLFVLMLLAQTTAFVSLDVFEFHRSADVLLVLIIGGAGWLYGGIAGAVIYTALQDGFASLTPQYWQFWIGLFLVGFVMIGRQRFVGGLYGLLAMVRRR